MEIKGKAPFGAPPPVETEGLVVGSMSPSVAIEEIAMSPKIAPTPLEKIIEERGSKYGPFDTQSACSQGMKRRFFETLRDNPQAKGLSETQLDTVGEGAGMILHKLSRIANGDPLYLDSWEDIAGYANAVINNLKLRK